MMLYQYTAILAKTMTIQANITFTDKRTSTSSGFIPLDSECKTGFVAGNSPGQAKEHAIKELKSKYPRELGWNNHDNVSVEMVEEEEVYV